jgi:hypothetical protein
MSNKRNAHNVSSGFKGNIPKAKVVKDIRLDKEGNEVVVGFRTEDHIRGDGIYHPTKGFRKVRQYTPHAVLNTLLRRIGLTGLYDFN